MSLFARYSHTQGVMAAATVKDPPGKSLRAPDSLATLNVPGLHLPAHVVNFPRNYQGGKIGNKSGQGARSSAPLGPDEGRPITVRPVVFDAA